MLTKSGSIRVLFFILCFLIGQLTISLAAANSLPAAPGSKDTTTNGLTAAAALASGPAYDSGWQEIAIRPDPLPFNFIHNLGGDIADYLVVLDCQDNSSLGTYDCTDQAFNPDAHWYALTNTAVTVWVAGGSRPDAIRLRIYTPSPAYDSDWQTILIRPDPVPIPINHNLGGNPDDYRVYLECRDDSNLGTYDCTDHAFNVNAHWYGLTDTAVTAWVAGGSQPDEVRLRLYNIPPAYDSGWQDLGIRPDPLPFPFNHNLGGNRDAYQIYLECKDDSSLGTYQCADFNFNINAHWYALTTTTVEAWVGNALPDEVRLRIWRTDCVYMPLVVRALN